MTAVTFQPDSQDLPKSLVKPKKFRFLRFFRKMYRGDTIRPRRTNQWMNAVDNHIVKNRTPLFHIGEYNTPDHSSIHISQQGKDKTVKKDKEKSIAKKWLTQVENYCDSTTLHGLKYVGDTSLTLGERAFWLVAFSIAICAAGYYISIIYQKWNSSPVIISFSPFDADLTHIPFPAITICNMNQAKKSEAEKTLLNGPDAERKILYGLCNDDNQTLGDYKNETTDNTSWETLRDFLLKVGTPCADMLRLCKWRNDIISCEDAFNNDLTDEGLCCSFNRLPDVKIYRNIKELGVLNRTYPDKVYDWSPEKGFSENETGEENYIPRRPLGAGAHLGLTIVLDAQIDNYYCSSTSSIGFKVILSNPLETPKMADFGFLLNPGSESRIAITPSIREATDNLRNIDIQKRQCFFASERRLKYYRTYTSRNCGQECLSNYTYEQCSCIPYYLPRKNYMKICELSDNECVRRAKNVMEISYKGKTCDCLPGCYEIVYSKSRSFADIPSSIDIIPDNFTSYNKTYFARNMAVLHFYFEYSKYTKLIKRELYDFTDFLANTGGLLGVFMGFSLLSVVEILYYFSLKIMCIVLKKRRKLQKSSTNIEFLN